MVRLIRMTAAEFQTYFASSVPDYADEHVKAGNWPKERAQELAEAQFHQLLPAGVDTPDNYLWRVVDERTGEDVGRLWFSVRDESGHRRGFVYDVQIFEQFRRRGYGRQAFLALEDAARDLGVSSIALHVFAHNAPARVMYDHLGFTERGIFMAKDLRGK